MQFKPSYLELVGLAYVQNLGLLMKRAPGELKNYGTMEKNYGTMEKLWYHTENYGALIYYGKNYGTMEKIILL